ncbi:MAG: ComEC/Rec2 family competence protein [Pseudomonadota bacterium]|nr:ComEC/Rec2 family competence protein [Pseudomonadota bacterium]
MDWISPTDRKALTLRVPDRTEIADWLAGEWRQEIDRRRLFHLLPVGIGTGAILVFGAGVDIHWSLWGALLVLSAFLNRRARAFGASGAPSLFLLAVAFGCLASQIELATTRTIILSGDATVRITARVLSHEADERGRARYYLKLLSTERPVLSRPPQIVRIVVSARHQPLRPGEIYRGLVRLGPPSGPVRPDGHDFAYRPYFEGLGAYGYGLGSPDPPPADAAEPDALSVREAISRFIAALRGGVTRRIVEVIGGESGAVAAALVTGERAGIGPEVEDWLRGTGLAHVLAISGLHMALVAGTAMLLIRKGLVLLGGLSLVLPVKKLAALVALAVSTFYLVLSGASVATERADVMILIMLVAVLFDRQAITLRNLSLAALAILLVTPHAVLTPSFQMSFAATLALVGLSPLFHRGTENQSRGPIGRLMRRVGLVLGATLVTALVAGLATAPYSAYHFQRLAPFGLLANLLTMPVFGLWIMPAALIGVFLMPFGLDGPVFWLMGLGLDFVLSIASFLHARFPDQAVGLMTPSGLVVLTAGLLILCLSASRLRWASLPILVLGLLLAPDRRPDPELLIYEDGRNFALLSADGLRYGRERPSRFVAEEWSRIYAPSISETAEGEGATAPAGTIPGLNDCETRLCHFQTSSGIRIAFTRDYRLLGEACDTADIAFVARAARTRQCRSGAVLVTLRTLRQTGSLAIGRDMPGGAITVRRSIPERPQAWNAHRLAPWPEFWRKPTGVNSANGATADDGNGQASGQPQ